MQTQNLVFCRLILFQCNSCSPSLLPLPVSEEINLDKGKYQDPESPQKNDKELVLGLSASIEDGVLTIESDMATHGVVVAIYDSSNALVYTSVSEIESRTHEFVVGTLPAGDYTLDVQVGDTLASGDFTIL